MKNQCAVVLAAGEGKRMLSKKPKVLFEVLFKPMLDWVCGAVLEAGVGSVCVVTGYEAAQVEKHLGGCFTTVEQTERLGTGHAVMQAKDFLEAHRGENVLVLCGDAPMMDSATIQSAFEQHCSQGNDVTVVSAELCDPTGYGRIVRAKGGAVKAIVEQKDADEETRRITEVNSGAYWFKIDSLLNVLGRLGNQNAAGEYYLTDAVSLMLSDGGRADAYKAESADVVLGANNRVQLNALNEKARRKVLDRLMEQGVEIPCLDGILVGDDVTVGAETVLLPGTILRGHTVIGCGCVIGPNSLIEDSTVGDGVRLNSVQCYQSRVHDGVTAGPFVHIRPNSELLEGVKIGDFVEVKNSHVGVGTKIPHLTYVGDSDVGAHVNFGCGCVTVNYDGQVKSRCRVGDHAFIGCNTNLIAPVTIGDAAYTAAGSTITDDVEENALAIARARQVNKAGWVKDKRK